MNTQIKPLATLNAKTGCHDGVKRRWRSLARIGPEPTRIIRNATGSGAAQRNATEDRGNCAVTVVVPRRQYRELTLRRGAKNLRRMARSTLWSLRQTARQVQRLAGSGSARSEASPAPKLHQEMGNARLIGGERTRYSQAFAPRAVASCG